MKELRIILVIALIIGAGTIIYFLYQKNLHPKSLVVDNIIPSLQPTIVPTIIDQKPTNANSRKNTINIPKVWAKHSDTDPQAKLTISLFLPPGYSFSFSGSEWNLVGPNYQEFWIYSNSILFSSWSEKCNKEKDKFTDFAAYLNQCCLDETRNHYNGGSRRAWYQKYLNGDFSCSYPASVGKTGSIISVEEIPINNSSYLKVKVKDLSGVERVNYLYVQNGILHIFYKSQGGPSSDSILEKNLDAMFSSLQSKTEVD